MSSLVSPIPFCFERRTAYVVGAASSGQSIARFLLRRGDRVLLSDRDPNRAVESRTSHVGGDLSISRGRHDFSYAARADFVVLSPGVPFDAEIARFARLRGKRVLGAVEFVASECPARLIVVTGTSGKTTTIDVLRRLVGSGSGADTIFLTDRNRGVGIAQALDEPGCRRIVAELSVAELSGVSQLQPDWLVVTNLAETNNHDDYASFDDYLETKLGWLVSLESRLCVLTGPGERASILRHFEARGRRDLALDFEIVPDGVGPMLALAERVRRILGQLELESLANSRQILDAIRATLLDRCVSIEGYAMPIINIGECKNPDSLAWTADAICADPHIITARSLDGTPASQGHDVIDLNQRPIALEEAIEIWTTRAAAGSKGTVVIDELTRKQLFPNPRPRFETKRPG